MGTTPSTRVYRSKFTPKTPDPTFLYGYEKSQRLFPDIMEGRSPEDFTFSCRRLKNYLWDSVEIKLRQAGPELRKREKAAELSIFLGMPEDVISTKYKAMAHFEKTTKVYCPRDAVSSIKALIQSIDVPNPFGSATNGAIEQLSGVRHNASHLHEKLQANSITQDINAIRRVIADAGHNDLFMHGTRAADLRKIFDDEGVLFHSEGLHDFGPGAYCFRNNFLAALTLALDRSYPDDNLGMVLYLGPHPDVHLKLVDVNTYVLNHATLSTAPTDPSYIRFNGIVSGLPNDQYKLWKTNLLAIRYLREELSTQGVAKPIFHGWLHECASTGDTNRGAVPIVDPDGWIQHAFTFSKDLGRNVLYLEFNIDWNEWASAEQVDEVGR